MSNEDKAAIVKKTDIEQAIQIIESLIVSESEIYSKQATKSDYSEGKIDGRISAYRDAIKNLRPFLKSEPSPSPVQGMDENLRQALMKIISEEEKQYQFNKDEADWFNNNTPYVGQTIDYKTCPPLPEWVTEIKELLAASPVQDIQAGNKLIAEFMGRKTLNNICERCGKDVTETPDCADRYPRNHALGGRILTLEYHTSWDWFHSAFDKFKTMQLKEWDQGEGTAWNHRYSFHLCLIGAAMVHTTILEAFERLVKAIEWYNQSLNKGA